jgi:hypothetical protein
MNLLKDYSLLWAELGVLLLGFILIWLAPGILASASQTFSRIGNRIVTRSKVAWVVAFAAPLMLRLLAWPIARFPAPSVHDEFSFLLMSDTFALGRLTNPTHPMWIHFETMHVLQRPTYASMYPVVQGLFLALGQVAAHAPWLGVWFSVVLMCGTFYWAFRAWMPPAWSLAGALLAAVRLGMFSYWMNSYYGGAPAAIGGALVLGALPRVVRFLRTGDALLLAIGMVVLANSRPFEGFFYCLPVAVVLIAWVFGADDFCRWFGLKPVSRSSFGSVLKRVIAPMTLVLVLAGVGMTYYFWRVTGNPLKMPYVAMAEQYSITPLFIWQKLRPAPHYNNETLEYFYAHWNTRSPSELGRFARYWCFYVGPALTAPLGMAWVARHDRKMRFFLTLCIFVILGLAIEWWGFPQYAAPMTAALYAVILQGLRHIRATIRRAETGPRWRHLAFLVPAVVVAMIALRFAMPFLSIAPMPTWPAVWAAGGNGSTGRLKIENALRHRSGKHLVLVRYVDHNDDQSIHDEWVYNLADIDDSPIVWARWLDEQHNRKLMEYFKDRRIWLCNSNDRKLVPLN